MPSRSDLRHVLWKSGHLVTSGLTAKGLELITQRGSGLIPPLMATEWDVTGSWPSGRSFQPWSLLTSWGSLAWLRVGFLLKLVWPVFSGEKGGCCDPGWWHGVWGGPGPLQTAASSSRDLWDKRVWVLPGDPEVEVAWTWALGSVGSEWTRHRAEVSDSVTCPGNDVPGLFGPVANPPGEQRRRWAAVTRWNSPPTRGSFREGCFSLSLVQAKSSLLSLPFLQLPKPTIMLWPSWRRAATFRWTSCKAGSPAIRALAGPLGGSSLWESFARTWAGQSHSSPSREVRHVGVLVIPGWGLYSGVNFTSHFGVSQVSMWGESKAGVRLTTVKPVGMGSSVSAALGVGSWVCCCC